MEQKFMKFWQASLLRLLFYEVYYDFENMAKQTSNEITLRNMSSVNCTIYLHCTLTIVVVDVTGVCPSRLMTEQRIWSPWRLTSPGMVSVLVVTNLSPDVVTVCVVPATGLLFLCHVMLAWGRLADVVHVRSTLLPFITLVVLPGGLSETDVGGTERYKSGKIKFVFAFLEKLLTGLV